jgi:tRNA1Val (adenine37-N6)-methyltransferase
MSVFHFKQFSVDQENSSMKVGTDAMLLGSLTVAESPKRILDVGAGTGVLSLMMAQKFPEAKVVAVELDGNALIDCEKNFLNSPWSERLSLVKVDFLEFESNVKFDLVISNPPFFENSLKNEKESKTLARHTDSLPVEGLIEKVSALLSEEGAFWLILPTDGANKLTNHARHHGLYPKCRIEIEGKPGNQIRTIVELVRSERNEFKTIRFCVRNPDGTYTDEYKALTIHFHNKTI